VKIELKPLVFLGLGFFKMASINTHAGQRCLVETGTSVPKLGSGGI